MSIVHLTQEDKVLPETVYNQNNSRMKHVVDTRTPLGALAILILLVLHVVPARFDDMREEDAKADIIRESTGTRMVSASTKEKPVKKSLPTENPLQADLELDKMSCGSAYLLQEHGYLFFELKSDEPCDYEFLGSRETPKCTAAILCNPQIDMTEKSDAGLCEEEMMMFTDGYEYNIECGKFQFGKRPRVPSPGNVDLRLYFQTSSSKRCIAYCSEEMEEISPPGVESPLPIRSPVTPGTVKSSGVSSGASGDTTYKSFVDCACGRSNDNNEVVGAGGAEAKKFEFPWLGSIVFSEPKSVRRQQFCGGALISNKWFLTAAQCFYFNNITAKEVQVIMHHHVLDPRLGKDDNKEDSKFEGVPGWDLPKETDASEETLRLEPAQVIIHPLFNPQTFDYDLALVRLKTPIDLVTETRVRPICLPRLTESFQFEEGKHKFYTAGWGLHTSKAEAPARVLQKLEVPFVDKKNCVSNKPGKAHMCAGNPESSEESCAGGRGSPLIYKMNEDTWMIAGTVSAGGGCASKVGLYTDIQEVLRWILVKNKGSKFCKRYLD